MELNRTEVKAPFGGFVEQIVKPGNFLERGQVCATIIQLDPISFVAGVPEYDINKVKIGQKVGVELVTGQSINGELTFCFKKVHRLIQEHSLLNLKFLILMAMLKMV